MSLRLVMSQFHVRVTRLARVLIVDVEGEVDVQTGPRLMAALNRHAGYDAVVVDFSKVPFASLAGIGPIVSLSRKLRRRGGDVALVAVRPTVARLLEVTCLTSTLTTAPDVRTAVGMLDGGAPGGPAAA